MRGRVTKLEYATTMNLSSNAHASQRFYDHFMITKMPEGYYRGYNPRVSQGTDQLAGQATHATSFSKGPNDRGLVKPSRTDQTLRPGSATILPSALVARYTRDARPLHRADL
jgi:hypothetical protein